MTTLNFFKSIQGHKYFDINYLSRKHPEEISKAPCENCENYERCRLQQLACRYYSVWMDSRVPDERHSRVPTAKTYKRIFGKRTVKKELIDD